MGVIGMCSWAIYDARKETNEAIDIWAETGKYKDNRVNKDQLMEKLRKDFWTRAFPDSVPAMIIFWPLLLFAALVFLPFFGIGKLISWSTKRAAEYVFFSKLEAKANEINDIKDIIQ